MTSKRTNHTTASVALKLVDSITAETGIKFERPEMADGDMGKVQELLFGQQLSTTTRQLEALQTQLGQQLTDSNTLLMDRINDLENRTAQADAARQTDLQNARDHWSSTLESTREQLLQELNDTTEALQAGKVDRQALSGLLGTIASELNGLGNVSINTSGESINVSGRK